MPGEKTEPPTPKRIKDARKKGQIFKSTDLIAAVLFFTAAAVLSAGGGRYVTELRALMSDSFQPWALRPEMPGEEMLKRMGAGWVKFLLLTAPLLGALFLAAGAINFLQVNVLFSPEILMPKLDKLNPLNGFKNIFFTSKTYLELIKNLIKFSVVFFMAYSSIKGSLHDIVVSTRMNIEATAALTGHLLFALLWKIGGVFVVIGAADYLLQKKMYMKNMMMSKQDIEKEYKDEEGDPHTKQMRKEFQHEMLNSAMTEHVPKASVVVVNPTHLAVAIRYDEQNMNAPAITAKGQNTMAKKIIELAKKSGVPVMRNVALAHSLYELEIGRDIPEDLYEAVAEVLNWVFQLTQEA